MFEPLVAVWRWIVSIIPSLKKRPRMNFLTVHYLYMIGMTIVGSIMLYPAGALAYIDALFFAAGMATQSGLNTVNINQLNTYQQVVMMLIPCICTPVFINTFVVFVRLYWFEKRFAHLVKEIRGQRRTRTKSMSRSKSQMKEDPEYSEVGNLEQGVNGRSITVLRDLSTADGSTIPASPDPTVEAEDEKLPTSDGEAGSDDHEKTPMHGTANSVIPTPDGSRKGSDRESDRADSEETAAELTGQNTKDQGEVPDPSDAQSPLGFSPRLNREITFADEVPARNLNEDSEQREMSKHIHFLERQQQDKKKGGALHIPGPRDFDRGAVPRELDDSDDELQRPMTRQSTTVSDRQRRTSTVDHAVPANADDNIGRRGITIDVPEHPGHRADQETANKPAEPTSRLERVVSGIRHRRKRGLSLGEGGRSFARTMSTLTARSREEELGPSPYLSWQATTGRNSTFFGLTNEQREELGGIEYRALKTLAGILLCYYFGFHLLGVMVLLPWIKGAPQAWWSNQVTSVGQSAAWWGIFTPASMFNDLGFTLTPDSMESFQYAVLPLLFGSFLIIIGNTGFPCMLRFVIWVMSKFTPRGTPLWEELRFLLDHPRRCFTLLFPSSATWWLFWVLVLLNGLDLIFFVILDLQDSTVTSLPPRLRVLNGWFQAASTRTAGFACVNLADLHPAIQVSYLVMMYISVLPIAISVRRTNVYEEKSLGIFGGEEEIDENGEPSYVGQHVRRQLSFDLWYIFLGFFVIAIVEGGQITSNQGDKIAFTMWNVLFEIVSAYGTVGLSLGYPNTDTSFSAQFHTISKLVIIAMMLRGRHRGLPYALDRAILLPSEKLQQKETEDAARRYRRGSLYENQEGRWSDADIDEVGLPRQHSMAVPSATAAGAGGVGGADQGLSRRTTRRASIATTNSQSRKHERHRSLGRFIAGGLGAGPSIM